MANVHPAAPVSTIQGWLELLVELSETRCAITGMHAATLQPPAGAAGELTGLLLMRAFHADRGEGATRRRVIIPDSAHGTNPASVTLGGYEVTTVPSDDRGCVDVAAFPAGDSAFGCRQMIGNVWEWTASDFLPYPGFVADPYKEYSAPWFGTHKVLRGGCWATRSRLLRNTFRNFYRPDRRDVWAGFRTCAV